MSLNFDNLSALTRDKYIPLLVDNIFESNVLTHRLLRKSKASASGNKVLQPVEYAKNASSGFYSGYDVMDTSPTEVMSSASFDWKQMYATISISGREEALNDGAERVIDLLEAKVKNAEKSMKDTFGTTLYGTSNGSGDEFVGLQHIIAEDRSLGGIDSTTYTWWDGGYVDAVSGSPTYANIVTDGNANFIQDHLRKAVSSLTIDGQRPTMIVTTPVILDAYEESLVAQKRFGASAGSEADAGFRNLTFRDIPVFADDHCPAGMMFFLNENFIQFRHHRKRNFAFEPYQKPLNQDARVAKILWLGALTCSAPRYMGKITGLPSAY
tara:strand:+ start:6182 stop:7156 length:975 start_codon:yes stop_codon:yes gene_type:complete